jgi:hypothetical protein
MLNVPNLNRRRQERGRHVSIRHALKVVEDRETVCVGQEADQWYVCHIVCSIEAFEFLNSISYPGLSLFWHPWPW